MRRLSPPVFSHEELERDGSISVYYSRHDGSLLKFSVPAPKQPVQKNAKGRR